MNYTASHSIREANRHKADSAMLEQILRDEYRSKSAFVYSGFFFVITILYVALLWLLPYVTTYVPSLIFTFWRGNFWAWSNAVWFKPGFITCTFLLLTLARAKNETLNFVVQNDVLEGSDADDYVKTQIRIGIIETLLVSGILFLTIYIFFVKDYI